MVLKSMNQNYPYWVMDPMGKQVVEYLLKEYEADGINQFCQRWRQVFVEALHPRFLPAGWDVMHSGKRDFGEFSVYNQPTKSVLYLTRNRCTRCHVNQANGVTYI